MRSVVRIIALLCLSLFWGASCRNPAEVVEHSDQKPALGRRLLVLAFQDSADIYGENVTIRCQLCGKMATTGEVRPDAAQFLTKHLNEMLDRVDGFIRIPAAQATGVIASLLSQSLKELSELDLYLKTGRALDADMVLAGYVYRFRDRDGMDYSVAEPASVAFHLDMIRIESGQIIWSGHFDETQRPLTEDLFQLETFIRRKGRWISVEDLAVYGLEKVLKTIPLS